MIYYILLTLQLVSLVLSQEEEVANSAIPSDAVLLNGACYIRENVFYFYGGIFNRLENSKWNPNQYSHSLESDFFTSSPTFNLVNDKFLEVQAPASVYNEEKDSITIFGGLHTDNKIFKSYNINKKEWNDNNKINDELDNKYNHTFSILSGTLTKHNDLYYQFGGISNGKTNLAIDIPTLIIYDANTNKLEFIEDLGISKENYLYDHTATLIKNEIYFIGGVQSDHKRFQPINEILVYNIETKKMSIKYGSGNVPQSRRGHSAGIINGHIYIMGGSTSLNKETFENDTAIYKLDPRNFIWQKILVPGFIPTYEGCLQVYQDNLLIYAFGSNENKRANLLQIIDTADNYTMPGLFQNQKLKSEYERLQYELSYKATYLGISLAGLVGLILFLIMFFIFFKILKNTSPILRRKTDKKALDQLLEPKPALFKFPSRSKNSDIMFETRLVEDDDNNEEKQRFSNSFIQFSEESELVHSGDISDITRV